MEDLYIEEQDRKDLEQERYGLALERIREMGQEEECDPVYRTYFQKQAAFAVLMEETYRSVRGNPEAGSGRIAGAQPEDL